MHFQARIHDCPRKPIHLFRDFLVLLARLVVKDF